MTFFYKNAINVFTDASVLNLKDNNQNVQVTCSGFITVKDGFVEQNGLKITHNATNSYGEIYAIKMGVENLLSHSDSDRFLNIFSDSKVSILGLRLWMESWHQNSKNKILFNSSNSPVFNQEIFLEIVRLIVQYNVHISFYHIPGHMRPNNINDMKNFKEIFLKNFQSNSYFENQLANVPDDILVELCNFNNVIDNMTRDYLHEIVYSDNYNPNDYKRYSIYPFYWFPKKEDIENYKKLVL